MTTMKNGPGSDPFSDSTEEDGESAESNVDESSTNTETKDKIAGEQNPEQQTQYPYVLRRDTVKDERDNEHVAFLRDEYAELEDTIRENVASELDLRQKEVSVTDLREAMVAVASNHPEEMAEVLLEWGYDAK
jgi:flagellar biosynthesis/type III secretory pathway M-ring protein FliF/YscJ